MDVVLDTNIFINGLFKDDGFCKALFKLKATNKISFVMNEKMQDELLLTFAQILLKIYEKKKENLGELKLIPLMTSLSKCLWQVKEIDHIINTSYIKDDPSDNKFIDCCIDGNVKYLITQDQHINCVSEILKKEYNISVLSPMQFYTLYKSHKL